MKRRALRTNPKSRKNHIIKAAVEVAIQNGYHNLKRNQIAKRLKIAPTLISHYFKMEEVKRLVLISAIENEIVEIISQCLCNDYPELKCISKELRKKAISFLNQ